MVDPDDVAFICLDLETTGLSPDTEWILEVGITAADKELHELASFESLVWPGDAGPLDNLTGLFDTCIRRVDSCQNYLRAEKRSQQLMLWNREPWIGSALRPLRWLSS